MLTLISSTLVAGRLGVDSMAQYCAFVRSNKVKMISPVIPANNDGRMCFSFWFAAFGAGDTTSLRIYQSVKICGYH